MNEEQFELLRMDLANINHNLMELIKIMRPVKPNKIMEGE